MPDFREQNRRTWDRLAATGSQFARVASDEECADPLRALDTRGWLPTSVTGQNVLCLASGGGWQSILYAVAGANVTVVDISEEMLALDQREANQRGLSIRTIHTPMDKLEMLDSDSFDIVHQPVSTCYTPDIADVYREIARLLKDSGLYISQHKQPASLQIVDRDVENRYVLGLSYYREGPLPVVRDAAYRESGATEYLHRWEQLVGELCRVGFVIEDLVEPRRGDPKAAPGNFRHRGMYVAPYVRLKARRVRRDEDSDERVASSLWVPD